MCCFLSELRMRDANNSEPFPLPIFSDAALAKLAKQDGDELSDSAILKELELSSKEIEVKALSGDWI